MSPNWVQPSTVDRMATSLKENSCWLSRIHSFWSTTIANDWCVRWICENHCRLNNKCCQPAEAASISSRLSASGPRGEGCFPLVGLPHRLVWRNILKRDLRPDHVPPLGFGFVFDLRFDPLLNGKTYDHARVMNTDAVGKNTAWSYGLCGWLVSSSKSINRIKIRIKLPFCHLLLRCISQLISDLNITWIAKWHDKFFQHRRFDLTYLNLYLSQFIFCSLDESELNRRGSGLSKKLL